MPSAAVSGLLWAHFDPKHVHADDYSLHDHEPEVQVRPVPSELSEVPAVEGGRMSSLVSAPSVGLARRASASMISGPGAGTSPPRTGTLVSSALIYITCCFGCSCLTMPWVSARVCHISVCACACMYRSARSLL